MKRTKFKRQTKPRTQQEKDKIYTFSELKECMSDKHKRFCHEYVFDYNIGRAYMKVYGPGITRNSAMVLGSKLLKNVKIRQYCEFVKKNIAEEVGISKIMLLKELQQIATAKLPDAYSDWITRKQLQELKRDHPELIHAIKEINTKVVQTMNEAKEPIAVEYVKVTLHDKIQAIEKIFKAMGWNEPDRVDLENTVNLGSGNVEAIRRAFGLSQVKNPLS